METSEEVLRLVDRAIERLDLADARAWVAKAIALCDDPIRAEHVHRRALLLDHAAGDVARIGSLLLTDGILEHARASGDVLYYALCLVIGARCELAAGRVEAAARLVQIGALELPPHLAKILENTLT